MRNLKRVPAEKIEQSLIADANNVDAWEAPVKVPSSSSPRPEWYQRKETPIGMTFVDCHEVDAPEVYDFIASHITGATAYAFRPKALTAAGVDFYLVLGAVASVTSIANVLWMAYDRFIAPRKFREDKSPGIYVAVQRPDGEMIHVWLGRDVLTREDFLERFEEVVNVANDPELRSAHQAKLRELRDSDSWIRVIEEI